MAGKRGIRTGKIRKLQEATKRRHDRMLDSGGAAVLPVEHVYPRFERQITQLVTAQALNRMGIRDKKVRKAVQMFHQIYLQTKRTKTDDIKLVNLLDRLLGGRGIEYIELWNKESDKAYKKAEKMDL